MSAHANPVGRTWRDVPTPTYIDVRRTMPQTLNRPANGVVVWLARRGT